jgi:hypothetical protein
MRALKTGKILAALLAASTLAAAAPSKPQDLHGTWRLNEDLTARMRESERQQEGGRPRFGGVGGGGRRGGPGGLPGGGFEDPPRNGWRGPEPSVEALAEITIEQTATQVTFTDAAGHKRTFTTDNHKVRDEQLPGGPAEVRAKWGDSGSLVVEIAPDKGPKRTETWVVSNDRKLLYLTVEMQGGPRLGFKIRRAYDAAAPGETKKPEAPVPPPGMGI